eukprot:gnl/TRDRNA2_/TRDRNA2_191372_c0_seq1.p1 gnl/TRDRNA2_/TRDRNA2_191372_c0~~gnl/TRDRNA2_/TRDRNA2_191372_c0_seq1.p1  ORF type:complete len:330 (+),score=61.93 gnl/TRDRNA2_/TRDRNA2_191372_c0_seq1:140-1129(+)
MTTVTPTKIKSRSSKTVMGSLMSDDEQEDTPPKDTPPRARPAESWPAAKRPRAASWRSGSLAASEADDDILGHNEARSPASDVCSSEKAAYEDVSFDPWGQEVPSEVQYNALCTNAALRWPGAGPPSSMVPVACILDAFFSAQPARFMSNFFDDAGCIIATKHVVAALRGRLPVAQIMRFTDERCSEDGMCPVMCISDDPFGSHLYRSCRAEPGKITCCFGVTSSGVDGDALKFADLLGTASANSFNIKLFVDDSTKQTPNYLKDLDVKRAEVRGDDFSGLFVAVRQAIVTDGPFVVRIRRSPSAVRNASENSVKDSRCHRARVVGGGL